MFSRRINTKSTLPDIQLNQELEAYEDACERVCNQRAAYSSKFPFTPYQQDGMIPRESMREIRKFEVDSLEAKLDQLYPWPKKPGLR